MSSTSNSSNSISSSIVGAVPVEERAVVVGAVVV